MSLIFRLIQTVLMAVALSCLMTLYVTWIHLGLTQDFARHWLKAWLLAALAAFVSVLLLAAPIAGLSCKLEQWYWRHRMPS